MKTGDLVQVNRAIPYEHRRVNQTAVILFDHNPQRPPDVGRVFDVLWDNGDIEDVYSADLEPIDESW